MKKLLCRSNLMSHLRHACTVTIRLENSSETRTITGIFGFWKYPIKALWCFMSGRS